MQDARNEAGELLSHRCLRLTTDSTVWIPVATSVATSHIQPSMTQRSANASKHRRRIRADQADQIGRRLAASATEYMSPGVGGMWSTTKTEPHPRSREEYIAEIDEDPGEQAGWLAFTTI